MMFNFDGPRLDSHSRQLDLLTNIIERQNKRIDELAARIHVQSNALAGQQKQLFTLDELAARVDDQQKNASSHLRYIGNINERLITLESARQPGYTLRELEQRITLIAKEVADITARVNDADRRLMPARQQTPQPSIRDDYERRRAAAEQDMYPQRQPTPSAPVVTQKVLDAAGQAGWGTDWDKPHKSFLGSNLPPTKDEPSIVQSLTGILTAAFAARDAEEGGR